MKTPAYILHTNFLTVIPVGGIPTTINNNDARFASALMAIKSKNWAALEEVLTLPKAIAKFTSGKVQVFDNQITFNNKPVHNVVTQRILEFAQENFPFDYLCKFLDKLMENPSERSREQVYSFMERHKHPITEDGDVLFFKVVTTDLKDCHTKTIDNSLGKIVKIDRKLVDDNPDSACATGLHCASWEYCESFGGDNTTVIVVKVNPKDIVSVPADSNVSKLRVCEYEVVKVIGDKKQVTPFTSNLAEKNVAAKDIAVSKPKDNSKLGADSAWKAHKRGQTVYYVRSGNNLRVESVDNKPRSFFRQHKEWYLS